MKFYHYFNTYLNLKISKIFCNNLCKNEKRITYSFQNYYLLSFFWKTVWCILWSNEHNEISIYFMDHQNLKMHIKRWQQISQRFLIDRSIQTNNNFLSLLIWWILMYTMFNCWNMPKVTQCQGYTLEKFCVIQINDEFLILM